MTSNERYKAILNFQKVDRNPVVEWAPHWDLTVKRWKEEGMPEELNTPYEINSWFGLDKVDYMFLRGCTDNTPVPEHGMPIVTCEADYNKLISGGYLYAPISQEEMDRCKEHQEKEGAAIWIWHEAFFWYPRVLFGIEEHLYSFYDHPELMKRMNEDLLECLYKRVDQLASALDVSFITLADDMSYNHGPMISEAIFKEQLAPFYQKASSYIKSKGIKVFVDSDGLVDEPIRWYREAGCQGFLPLEKQAGVDLNKYREKYPDYLFLGGFDKLCMDKGEEAIRAEFERLFPVMKQGGYILGVDHQTPPAVSLEDYRLYLKIYREFAEKAAK